MRYEAQELDDTVPRDEDAVSNAPHSGSAPSDGSASNNAPDPSAASAPNAAPDASAASTPDETPARTPTGADVDADSVGTEAAEADPTAEGVGADDPDLAIGGSAAQEDILATDDPLKAALAGIRSALAPLMVATKIKPSDPAALEALLRFVAKNPSVDAHVGRLQAAIDTAGGVARALRAQSLERFSQTEATYVRGLRAEGTVCVEGGRGWRVGPVELRTDAIAGRIQGCYNKETVVPWTDVKGPQTFAWVKEETERRLARMEIALEELAATLSAAYRSAVRNGLATQAKGGPALVPLTDLYLETRLELLRQQLVSGKASRKVSRYTDFPLWAFLYNLDRYRAAGGGPANGHRLVLQTGSQRETSKGVVTGGLLPDETYRVFCYAYSVGG